jgi:hypothetical protein
MYYLFKAFAGLESLLYLVLVNVFQKNWKILIFFTLKNAHVYRIRTREY